MSAQTPPGEGQQQAGHGPPRYEVRALFLTEHGIRPDFLMCSGLLPDFGGKPCPYAAGGHMPRVLPLDPASPTYTIDKGKPGDFCPPCAKQQLGHLGHWQGHGGQQFPAPLLGLRLFKCRMWFWLVVPGLAHEAPTLLSPGQDQDGSGWEQAE